MIRKTENGNDSFMDFENFGWGRELICLLLWLPVIIWFLFGEVSSSSGCLGWATLFYCGTP